MNDNNNIFGTSFGILRLLHIFSKVTYPSDEEDGGAMEM